MGTNGIIRFEEYFTEDGKTFPCYGYGTVRDSVCWFDYDNATDFYDNVAVVRKYKGSSFALINQDLQIIASSIQWEDYMNFYNSNNAGLYVFRNKNSKQAGVFNKSGVLLYKIDVDPSENNCVVVGKDLLFTLGSDRLLTAYSKYDGNVVFKDKRWTWDAYSFFLNSFRNINDYSIVGYQGFDNYSILDPSGKILYNR